MTVAFRLLLGRISLLAGCALAFPVSGSAQTAPPASQMDLKSSDAGRTLASAMSRLANNPRDINALNEAGEAALQLDDPRSAIGFFGRADDVSPNNGRVKAGLGRSMLAMGQTVDGLRLMEQAATLNYADVPLLLDRALARDLTGNQAGAQRDYQEALRRDPQNQLGIRRYAVSLGISGQVDLAEATLQPLLYKNDRAAWRDRAFILAMNGRTADALDITTKTMPPALADAIKPYIERMAMLTPGQRAAAVHMGQFPAGLVNVRVASKGVPAPPVAATTQPAAKKGRKQSSAQVAARSSRRTTREAAPAARQAATAPAARAAASSAQVAAAPAVPSASAPSVPAVPPPAPAPSPQAVAAVAPSPSAPTPTPAPARAAPQPAQPVRMAAAPAPTPAPASVAAPVRPSAPKVELRPATSVAATPRGPGEATGAAPSSPPAATPPVQGPPAPSERAVASAPSAPAPAAPATAAPPAPAESTRSLADIMAAIRIPEAERHHDVTPVNLAEIAALQAEKRKKQAAEDKARKAAEAKEAARRKAEAEAKAKADAEKKRLADNPARYWVQIGVGRDKGALAFTLNRMKKSHDALAKQDGWSASWGQTNRLVVGPFPNLTKAKAVEADLRKAGSDAFVWRSGAGEEVDRVGG